MAKKRKRKAKGGAKGKLEKSSLGPSSASRERAKTWSDIPRWSRYKQIREDATVGLALAVIKGPIVSVPWEVECDPLDDSEAQAELAEEIRDWLTDKLAVLWPTLAPMALNKIDFGRVAVEKEFAVGADGFYHIRFRDYDPEDTTPLKDEAGDFAGIKYRGEALGRDRCMLFVNDMEFGNLNGRSRFKRIEKKWWYCEKVYELLNRYLERKADPPAKGYAPNVRRRDPAGNEYNPLKKLEDAAQDLRSGGDVMLPSETDEKGTRVYGLDWMTDDQRAPMLIAAVEFYEKMKLRGLLVPERVATQDEGTGAYGMSETHKDAFMSTEGMVLDGVTAVVNVDLLDQWVTANWGADAPRAYLRTKGLSKEIEALIEKVMMGIAQSFPQALAAIVDLVAWCEAHEIPLVPKARELLEKVQANAAAALAGPVGGLAAPGLVSTQLKSGPLSLDGAPPEVVVGNALARYGPGAAAFFEKLLQRVMGGGDPAHRADPFRRAHA